MNKGEHAEMAMPRLPGDAVLSPNRTVKVQGVVVGVWWVDGNGLYHFDFARPANEESGVGVVTHVFRYEFRTEIPKYLARVGKVPAPPAR